METPVLEKQTAMANEGPEVGDKIHRASVNILGEKYVIRGDARPEYIAEVAHMVDSRMRELRASAGNISKSRLAVLAAINIADELMQARSEPRGDGGNLQMDEALTERTRQLITLLDEGLIGDTLG